MAVLQGRYVSKWAGVRIGLLSRGDFENVAISNCIFRDIGDAGLKIQMCEGAAMKRMTFTDLVMVNVPRPIFATLCRQRACTDAPDELPPVGRMRDLLFANILVDSTGCGRAAAMIFTGLGDHPIENITLDNIRMQVDGGGYGPGRRDAASRADARCPAGTLAGVHLPRRDGPGQGPLRATPTGHAVGSTFCTHEGA